jgi:hypothetical protein
MNRTMIATLAAVAAISLGGGLAHAADANTDASTDAAIPQQSYAFQSTSTPTQAPVMAPGDNHYPAFVSVGSHGTWLFPPAQDTGAN